MLRASIRTIAIAVSAAALLAPLGLTAVARAEDPVEAVPTHVSEAVLNLIALDQERVDDAMRVPERQDVVRQEVTVCVDPAESRLSGRCRLWIESSSDHVRLMLNARLEVLMVRDSRGDSLAHSRLGDVVVVHARDGEEGFPLEIAMTYEGDIEPGDDAWVSPEFVALGPRFRWYPVSEERDPARLRVEARYPTGYSSVVSGTLAGMATSLGSSATCAEGDVWEIPTPVTNAGLVVGSLESSLTVAGDVFFGHHILFDEDAGSDWRGSPASVPKEFLDLLRFLEACYGPYPYEWVNIVRLPGDPGRPAGVIAAPGLVVVRAPEGSRDASGETLGKIVAGLTRSWWTYWIDPGPMMSEGLAAASESWWHDATGDEDGALRLRGLMRSRLMMALSDAGRSVPLGDCMGPDPLADVRICGGKGSAVLEMLQSVVGDAYCEALKGVASEHGGGTVGFGTFVEAFEREYERDLDWFFYEWVARGDLPSYAFEYEATPAGNGTYMVRGTVHQEGEPFRTPLPLTVDLGGWAYDETIEIESAHQSFTILTDAEPMRLAIDGRGLIPKVNRVELALSRHRLGTEAAELGDWARAVDELGAAASLEPDNAGYSLAYARALVRYGLLSDGLASMDRAVELDPANAILLLEASTLHLRSGGFAQASRLLDSYVEANPEDPTGHVRRARALVELGLLDQAATALAVADELKGDVCFADLEEETLLATGRLHERRGEPTAAARAYEAALAVNPVSDEARRLLRALVATPSE